MSLLNDTIEDIGRGLYAGPPALQGPNGWANMTSCDFGPRWDFELEDHITKWVFTPVSNAALQWCYAHLPEDCPRYGARGFLIEAEHIKGVTGGARRAHRWRTGRRTQEKRWHSRAAYRKACRGSRFAYYRCGRCVCLGQSGRYQYWRDKRC